MHLVIAEKPKMAKAIAAALGSPKYNKESNYYTVGEYYVLPLQGHILETMQPDEYDEKYKKWDVADLPIIPNPWKLKPNKTSRGAQKIKAIKSLVPKIDTIIHAGDPDNEGQLLVDEVIQHLGIKKPVQRVLCADLTARAIQKSFSNIESNESEKFRSMHNRALARQRGDWLLGMNLTRFYTVTARQAGLDQLLTYGRVQISVLGLVVTRCNEIKHFKPHDYFEVKGVFSHSQGNLTATWRPADKETSDFDSEGRLIKKEKADSLKSELKGKPGEVTQFERKRKKKKQPLPYTLSDLQGEGNRRFGLSMQQTLDLAQKLYDQYDLTTYPRSDVAHLPEDQHQDAKEILSVVAANMPGLAGLVEGSDPTLKSHAWNTSKIKGHYGIIPTGNKAPEVIKSLSAEERGLYEAICKRYVAQFYPEAEFDETQVTIKAPDVNGEAFSVTGRVPVKPGWEAVFGKNTDNDQSDSQGSLPEMKVGDTVNTDDIIIGSKKTQPPKPFTEDTLNKAMNNIHLFVTRDDLKKVMKEGDGIGTEATRGQIVEKLFERGYLKRKKKEVWATDVGLQYYSVLPEEVATPDMAGIFEISAKLVEQGKITVDQFEKKNIEFIERQLSGRQKLLEQIAGLAVTKKQAANKKDCPNCEAKMTLKKGKSTYWLCAGCDSMYGDNQGEVGDCFKGALKEEHAKKRAEKEAADLKDAPSCEHCQAPLKKLKSRKGKGNFFFACTNKGDCGRLYSDDDGTPGKCFAGGDK